jgi:hypothetical protein
MDQRELSPLQMAYRTFFRSMLEEYAVISPAELSREQKSVFFTRIREEWKVQKAEFLRSQLPKPLPTKREQYARLNMPEKIVAIAPRESAQPPGVEVIQSVANPRQTDDLRINFFPNPFFEQVEPYQYPVVKMPRSESLLKLPRVGRASGKGYKENDFLRALRKALSNWEVSDHYHMPIPYFNRPYEPDIVIASTELNLYVDIEIDEPYDGFYRFPTHERDKDDTRDLFFTESGWVVIRFTERQVHTQEGECVAYVQDVLNSIASFQWDTSSRCIPEPQWEYQQAISWQRDLYREKYLGIQKFGEQKTKKELLVDIAHVDSIESYLNRTPKPGREVTQEAVAFEDETHTYRHPRDLTGNAEYLSVTKLIDRFFPFDLNRYISKKAEHEQRDAAEVLEEFVALRDEAASCGTSMHETIEQFLKTGVGNSQSREFRLFQRFYDDVIKSCGFHFVEAEKRVLLERYNLAGTVDAVFRKPKSGEWILIDWKRSKNLVVDGHPKKYGYGFALSKLNHLDNSSYYKYALQQNMYKYMLEQNECMTISSMNLIVLHPQYDVYYRVVLPDLQKEVMILLDSINHKI